MALFRADTQDKISIRKIKRIPDNLQKYNESFIDYSYKNFESICYLTEIKDKEIQGQYLIGKNKTLEEGEFTFDGLQDLLDCELVQQKELDINKEKYLYEGAVVFQAVPSKNKSHTETDEENQYDPKISFDNAIDISRRTIPKGCSGYIISTIQKQNGLIDSLRLRDWNTNQNFIIFLIVSIWFGIEFSFGWFLTWKIIAYIPRKNVVPIDFLPWVWRGGQTLKSLMLDMQFYYYLIVFIVVLIIGFGLIRLFYKKQREIDYIMPNKNPKNIAKAKRSEAEFNHKEEMERCELFTNHLLLLLEVIRNR